MMNSLIGKFKGLFSDPIKRKVIFLGIMLFLTSFVLLSIQEVLQHLINQKVVALSNQRARRELGKVLILRFLKIELHAHDLYYAMDSRELDILYKRISELLKDSQKILKVLQNGGTFEDTLRTNFQQINQISQKIVYQGPDQKSYIIEVIDITPKIIDLEHIFEDLKTTLNSKIVAGNQDGTKYARHADILLKQAHTVLSRSQENANKIFYDTQMEMQRLMEQIDQTRSQFGSWRFRISAILLILSFAVCWMTLRQIGKIIQERRLFSINLHRAHESINHMVHAMPMGIVVVGYDHRIKKVNRYAAKLLEAGSIGELIGKRCSEIFCDPDHVNCPLIENNSGEIEQEITINALRGSRPIVLKKAITITLNNEPVIVEAFLDISDRKRAEQALREKQDFIKAIFQAVPVGIAVIDPEDKRIIDANLQAMRILEAGDISLIGQSCRGLLCSKGKPCLVSEFDQNIIDSECNLLTLAGNRIPIIKTASKVQLKGRECIIESFMDISRLKAAEEQVCRLNEELEQRVVERTAELAQANENLHTALRDLKETQSQLLQSEKMASIGQLAAGVAHEINNPVGFVLSNLNTIDDYRKDITELLNSFESLAAALTSKKETIQNGIGKHLDDINAIKEDIDLEFIQEDYQNVIAESFDGLDRVIKIVADLKNFAHAENDEMQWADLNEGLEKTLNIVRNEIKYKAEVIKEFGKLPEVRCYPQKINQVFMNLLVNAAQCFEETGWIKIKTAASDEFVTITISDNGSGISPENLNKIFDPFFTTKEVGKGTGLGLHVVYNIVNSHNGSIEVVSNVGKGTRFMIHLPIDPQKVKPFKTTVVQSATSSTLMV